MAAAGTAYELWQTDIGTSSDDRAERELRKLIDAKTLNVKTIEVGGTPADVAVGAGGVWVTVNVR